MDGDRYVLLTSHFNLFERPHMLHRFARTLEDFYVEPERMHRLIDLILHQELEHLAEAARRPRARHLPHRRLGTQESTLVSPTVFREFFQERYRQQFDSIHGHGWHLLHSCGKVNDFVALFIESGADVLNLQQPRAYGIEAPGTEFAGKVCFLTTVDIQATLPTQDPDVVRAEARELLEHWSTPQGGFIVFDYGDSEGIGVSDDIAEIMFREFYELREFWCASTATPG